MTSLSTSGTRPFAARSRGSWMYADPYAYQYSSLDDAPPTSPKATAPITSSGVFELEGSTPASNVSQPDEPYEVAAIVHVGAEANSASSSSPDSPCGLRRSRLSIARGSQKILHHRGHKRASTVQFGCLNPGTSTLKSQPEWSGLIPVTEDVAMSSRPSAKQGDGSNSISGAREYFDGLIPVKTEDVTMASRPLAKQEDGPKSISGPWEYFDGLIPVNEGAASQSSSSSKDFDTILRNIGVNPKADRRRSRLRGDRYYDKFGRGVGL